MIIALATRILFAAYFLEAGLILFVGPWTAFWDRNFFASTLPAVAPILGNLFVRGAVSGVGLLTVVAGFAELVGIFGLRRPPGGPSGQGVGA